MLEVLVGIFGLLLLVFGYAIFNLSRKLENAEEYVNDLEEANTRYYTWFNKFKQTVNDSYSHIRQVDRIGSFEADDETGFIFKTIKDMIASLNKEF